MARPSMIGRNDSRCSLPNPQNLWIFYLTWQRGINVTDKIKLSNQLILKIGRLSWIMWAGPL